MFCPKCGKENDDNAVFCRYCGAKMNKDKNKKRYHIYAERVKLPC